MYLKPLKNGAPGEIRTPDHLVRSQVLYPAELRAHYLRGREFYLQHRQPYSKIFGRFHGGRNTGNITTIPAYVYAIDTCAKRAYAIDKYKTAQP